MIVMVNFKCCSVFIKMDVYIVLRFLKLIDIVEFWVLNGNI